MYRKRPSDQEIGEIIDGEIMDWDLQEFGWESSTDLDPRDDHDHDHDRGSHYHQLSSSDHHLVLLDFTNSSAPQKSTSPSSEPNSRLTTSPTKAHEPMNIARASAVDSSPSTGESISKRLILSSGTQKMSCSVDGCNADLSGCRDYHRRHRVCESHSKTPIVIVKGEEKRFCQQCSRFHSLGEFDEVKRSCRKRLDGHNRRRRKSQPEPLYFSSKNFLSGFKGPRILHFGNPQIYATASVRSMWPVETKSGSESWLYGPHSHRRLQVINQPSPQISFNGTTLKKNISLKAEFSYQTNSSEQLLCHPFEPPGRARNDNDHVICDEEVSLPIDSGGRALYLLSTNPTPQHSVQQPSEGGCSFQLLDYHPKDKPPLDPLPTPNYYYDIANKTNSNNGEDVYATNMMLRMGPDSLLEHGAFQMLPISLD